jgi:uncharacterized membrane protein
VAPRGYRAALWALIALYAAIYSAASIWKYQHYLYDDIDLAIFAQAEAQLMRGSLFSSIRGMAWLGDHASLNLFLIAPLYALFRTPLTLLIVQSVALAIGALAVHGLALREVRHAGAALACAAVYLLNPALGHLNLFEFHPEVLSTPALLFAFLALREGRVRRTLGFALLALLGKEDVALVVGTMGLYAWTVRGPRRWGLGGALIALAGAMLAFNMLVLKPAFASGGAEYQLMYREWGASIGEVARNVVTRPLDVLGALAGTAGDAFDTMLKRTYWLETLLPVGFLPLLAPLALLIPLPIVVEHFLSWRYPQHAILNQYAALVTPFVVAAAVLGFARLARGRRWPARATPLAALALVACAAYGQWLHGPFRETPRYWSQRLVPTPADRALNAERDRMLARVPARGGVVASHEFLARLSGRDSVHSANHLLSGAHTFSTRAYETPAGVSAAIVHVGRTSGYTLVNEGTSARWRAWAESRGLAPVDFAGDLMLWLPPPEMPIALVAREAPPESAQEVGYEEGIAFLGARVDSRSVGRSEPVEFSTWWRRTGELPEFVLTQFVVVSAGGEVVDDRVRFLGYTVAPPQDWPPGVAMRERYRLVLPEGLAAGTYGLGMRLWRRGSPPAPATATDPSIAAAEGFVRLGEFTLTE